MNPYSLPYVLAIFTVSTALGNILIIDAGNAFAIINWFLIVLLTGLPAFLLATGIGWMIGKITHSGSRPIGTLSWILFVFATISGISAGIYFGNGGIDLVTDYYNLVSRWPAMMFQALWSIEEMFF